MVSYYHGSSVRYFIETTALKVRDLRNVVLRRRRRVDEEWLRQQKILEQFAIAGDWEAVHSTAIHFRDLARKDQSSHRLSSLGAVFERMEAFSEAHSLRAESRRVYLPAENLSWPDKLPAGADIVILPVALNRSSISWAIQYGSLLGWINDHASSCLMYLEPRLVPLFQRTYPRIQFRPERELAQGYPTEGRIVFALEQLPVIFGKSKEEIAKSFRPLKADEELTKAFRKSYLRNGRAPLVGISWGSKAGRKDFPAFEDWNVFLKDFPGTFVSIQYGRVNAALRKLRKAGQCPLIDDKSVDQMVDMDRFAAQVSSLDAVVTISNTGAHLAGTLGIPTIVLADDKFQLFWPMTSNKTPWYPKVEIIRKRRRAWPEVLVEARARLMAMLESG